MKTMLILAGTSLLLSGMRLPGAEKAEGIDTPAADAPKATPAETAKPAESRKARVAVLPALYAKAVRAKTEQELGENFKIAATAILENPLYTGFLIDALVNSRRFDVLERENLQAVAKELDLGESAYADTEKVVRLGKTLNADYVAIPEILGLQIKQGKPVPYIEKASTALEGHLTVSLRAVEVATSRIAASHVYSTVRRQSRKADQTDAEAVSLLTAALYRESATEGAGRLTDVIYPIRIVLVGDESCVINRGRDAIKPGEILDVYKPGEMLVDPDTKEKLGYHETLVGRIEVTEVAEKTATARIRKGAGAIERMAICRRQGRAATPPEPAPKLE